MHLNESSYGRLLLRQVDWLVRLHNEIAKKFPDEKLVVLLHCLIITHERARK